MSSRAYRASVSSGEQDEAIRQLIAIGEEQGYLLREEIDAVLPAGVTASSVLDDLRSRCGDAGIAVDSESLERERAHHARANEAADEADLTPGRPDTSSDIVRLYLANMKRGPLLTRQEEVTLAKRIERSHRMVMVTLSHTPAVGVRPPARAMSQTRRL